MIAKYKNLFFNIALNEKPMRLWRYDEVDGFNKRINRTLAVYEKNVDISEIEEIFDVGFSVKWNGRWCGANPSKDGKSVNLLVGLRAADFAKQHSFYEVERDKGMIVAWGLDVDINTCEEFRMVTQQKHPYRSENEKILCMEEWLEMYRRTKTELSPCNYC